MVKQNKMICIDEELIDLLKEESNVSGLINDLLINHFHETPNFKKQRLIQRAKQVNTQQILLKEEEEAINLEMKAFIKSVGAPKEEIKEINKVKTFTRQGDMEKNDRKVEDEAQ